MALAKIQTSITSVVKKYPIFIPHVEKLHCSSTDFAWSKESTVYPPQSIEEEPRPAFVCHQRTNIKYSPWKMWYVACLVRGMPVDEAIKQLKFVAKKGSQRCTGNYRRSKGISRKRT
ncbi:hypothetical protein NQ317_019046 [Molorchus minor]|uniref:Large ribosomal subunit protein uL22m n=1 Tax=Molorchus minor TaxID=1323400 RepID=A0ABQ9JWE9_9CUCU|nr:hypothetical protein NQ317_019046 [Molorchus minor]